MRLCYLLSSCSHLLTGINHIKLCQNEVIFNLDALRGYSQIKIWIYSGFCINPMIIPWREFPRFPTNYKVFFDKMIFCKFFQYIFNGKKCLKKLIKIEIKVTNENDMKLRDKSVHVFIFTPPFLVLQCTFFEASENIQIWYPAYSYWSLTFGVWWALYS